VKCDCGSGLEYSECCEPYLKGEKHAPTAEALMRSRYTAHVRVMPKYIIDTLAPESRKGVDEKSIREWAKESEWLGLKILSTKDGQPNDKKGVVEFVATYKTDGKELDHHEVSQFRKDPKQNRWYFVDGDSHTHEAGQGHHHHHEPVAPVVREGPKVGRNDPCPCGSGKKYKKCHGA
jgi:SEC-C motif-containing protein